MEGEFSYKLISEKALNGTILLMKWSPKMDLIALAMEDNSVLLHRFSWQRVWSIEPGDVPITALSWRPDGQVLGVSYSNGTVHCHSIKDGNLCFTVKLNENITSLLWIEQQQDEAITNLYYKDPSEQFVTLLPSADNSEEEIDTLTVKDIKSTDDSLLSHSNSTVTLLIAGDKLGNIHFIIDGVFYLTSINDNRTYSGHVIDLSMSHDWTTLAALCCHDNGALSYELYDTKLLSEKATELHFIAVKYNQVNSVVNYLGNVLRTMADVWEDGLSNIDKKMEDYATTLPPYLTMMDEFIILLACGQARSELKAFLLESLTAKGVKKLGHTLEMSYKSLRRYTINHIERTIQVLNFHLHDLLSVSKWIEAFGPLGLSQSLLQDSIKTLGELALKTQEFLFVIDDSFQNLKIFFIWLHTIIIKLSGENTSTFEEGPSPDDLQMVINFLKKRLKPVYVEGRGQTFSLDRVGQYLLAKDLLITEDYSNDTLWNRILSNTTYFTKESNWLLIENKTDNSLLQLYQSLQTTLCTAFESCQSVISPLIKSIKSFEIFQPLPSSLNTTSTDTISSSSSRLGCLHSDGSGNYICLFKNNDFTITATIHDLCNNEVKYGHFFINDSYSENNTSNCEINDFSLYDKDTLSLLYSYSLLSSQQQSSYMVAQLPLDTITMATTTIYKESDRNNIGNCLNEVTSLGRFQAKNLAVSGSRKLAAIVSVSGKRIQLYDVDAEEDEDI